MAEIKLTKNELRAQQGKLSQLEKYLPTLQLKKAMLQLEVNDARIQIEELEATYNALLTKVEAFASLLTSRININLETVAKVQEVKKHYENIAGVEVPYFEAVTFHEIDYNLFDTPPWIDSLIAMMRGLAEGRAKVQVAREKKEALERELREVSIRVNLFEKILIPRAKRNIKKVKVFLGDQELAAVSQAKAAKSKIEARKNVEEYA